jgi:5-(carboxyamino)imidazole ribonucleotide synthase
VSGLRVGVLGAGQLGRMLALAGYPLGMQFRFLDPDRVAPAGSLGEHVVAPYDDEAALDAFADGVDVVTYEFENVPVAAARRLAEHVPVYPPPAALEVTQDRLAEKHYLEAAGFRVARFAAVDTVEDLQRALAAVGLPAVLKTRRMGYDGKGQAIIRERDAAALAFDALGGAGLILEEFITFDRELSLVIVRSRAGALACYPLVENRHRDGILRETRAPAQQLTEGLQADAQAGAERVMAPLNYVGCLAIEFFQRGDQLIANELAPRVHNTGHWTIDGAVTSQFENHLRAITGLPLGDTSASAHTLMLNIIGAFPELAQLLDDPASHVHDYGKAPRPNRKLGHVTLVDDDSERLEQRALRIRGLLT